MTPTSSFRVADDSFMTRQLDKEPPVRSLIQGHGLNYVNHNVMISYRIYYIEYQAILCM